MPRLFAELYFDEDVDVLIAEVLARRGFSVLTTRTARQLHAEDAQQLAYAVQQRRVFVTHNRQEFERLAEIYFQEEQDHWGIIIAVRRPPHELVRRLADILNSVTADELQNQLRYI